MRYERKGFKEQLSMMVREIEKDPSIMTSSRRRLSRFDILANVEQWTSLAAKLNSVKNGKQKTAPKWKQSWRDLVYQLKKKYAYDRASLTQFERYVLKVNTYFVQDIVNNASDEEGNSGNKNSDSDGQVNERNTPDITALCPDSSITNENRKRTNSKDSSDTNKKKHVRQPVRRSARVLQMKEVNGFKA